MSNFLKISSSRVIVASAQFRVTGHNLFKLQKANAAHEAAQRRLSGFRTVQDSAAVAREQLPWVNSHVTGRLDVRTNFSFCMCIHVSEQVWIGNFFKVSEHEKFPEISFCWPA